jgi:type VI protein secretion system component VasK
MSRLPWRWILSGIGALLIAALVWIFGPLLSFLEDVWPRAAIVAVIALVWFGVNFWLWRTPDGGARHAREGARLARLSL